MSQGSGTKRIAMTVGSQSARIKMNCGSSDAAVKKQARLGPSSLLRSSPAFVILATAIASSINFADPDLWMHLMVGRRILSTGHIPQYNPYSYSAVGLPWHNHVWLAQVILALSYEVFGIVGLKMVKLLCTLTAMVALARGLSQTKAPPSLQRVVLVATAVAIMVYVLFRPQLFTIAMLSIIMSALASEVYRGQTRLWPLIPMFALWANLHGEFIVGLGALAVAAVTLGLREFWAERKIERASRIAAVTIGCALATLLNPFGLGLWTTVLHSVSDPLVRKYVLEWLPLPRIILGDWNWPPGKEILNLISVGLFAAFLIFLVAAPALEDAPLVAVALIFMGAAIYSGRNLKLALVAVNIPLAHHLGLALERQVRPANQESVAPGMRLVVPLGAALMIALLSGEFSNRLQTADVVPSGAVAFMKQQRLHGNILGNFNWGGYLVWHGAPADKVFIDSRCEVVYPDSVLREYLAFLYGWPRGETVLDRYPHDFVLIEPQTAAYRLVAADARWKLIYRDPVAVLFARAGAPIARRADARPRGAAAAGPFWFP
jgi:hypothetical protein